MNLRKCLSVGLLVAGLTVPTASQAQLFWNFSATTGPNTIAGKLTTDGIFNDTLGAGTHVFSVTAITELNLNTVNQLGNFASGDPLVLNASNDSFTWSRDTQSVTAYEGGKIEATEGGGNSLFTFAATGGQVNLIDAIDAAY